jgi:hypothetical protein
MKEKQEDKCAICKRPFDRTPHVDHSHKTGKIRGLLCFHCNSGLGMFGDCMDTMESAINYLILND